MVKGDRVMRIAGTSVGFRVRTYHTIEDVSRTHIKVRNDDGQVSPWFLRSDFMWISQGHRHRRTSFLVLIKNPNGAVTSHCFDATFRANSFCREMEGLGNVVLAKKKVTIPYVLPDVAVGG